MPDIGQYNKRIEFINIVRTQNDSGGFNEADSTIGERWANVKASEGNRGEEGEKTVINRRYKIRCRYDKGLAALITSETRILYNGKRLAINGYSIEGEDNGYFIFDCNEHG